MKIGIKLQSLIPIFIYCFSAERQGFEPTTLTACILATSCSILH